MAHHGRRRGGHAEHENEERWLLTYADMLTLLFALFMVLFSISSVNISKYQVLQQSLKAAFSGSVLSGGKNIIQAGSESTANRNSANADIPAIVALTPSIPRPGDTSAQQIAQAMEAASGTQHEQADFVRLKALLDTYARTHGFSKDVVTAIDRRGLVVRILTDKLLFDSGQASLQTAGLPLLDEIAHLLDIDQTHPITVEGYTDNVPISTPEFPSNWELSAGRASTVVRFLIAHGVSDGRLAAAGYAYLHPVATNATAAGRALNRRVDIVLNRLYPAPTTY
jgi:chemotaxis protein MotB